MCLLFHFRLRLNGFEFRCHTRGETFGNLISRVSFHSIGTCIIGMNFHFCGFYFGPLRSAILFWSFEISDNILRNQKQMIGLDSYSRQVFV